MKKVYFLFSMDIINKDKSVNRNLNKDKICTKSYDENTDHFILFCFLLCFVFNVLKGFSHFSISYPISF